MTTAPVGCLDGEQAPKNSLPDWSECALRVANSEAIARRVSAGGHGADADSKLASELHRFIYEYDDADRYRSAWFLHRLELLLEETRRSASRQEGWQLVPVEPTDDMLYEIQENAHILPPRGKRVWKMLLAAAPHQAQEAQGDRHGE